MGLAGNCWKIPDAMPFDEAAALLMTYGTSQHALKDRAQLRSGETLLVLGAAGGVGLAAVELGKAMGARVVAAASSAEKLALAREHGADEGVQYPLGALDKSAARALTDRFKAACGADGAQVIYDAVGGDYTRSGAARDRLAGTAPGGGISRRHSEAAAQSAAAQELPDRRRVLGRVHRPQSGAARRQCRGA